ncbi:MAG TPA: adenylate/guanylate cyclase domain-containing protein [Opitutaceae bacterium]|jgi:class 3 adenylate cyclase|nr:adenylate/guanylate cyclase domain-containing protein [Opitutaceae bacterium]
MSDSSSGSPRPPPDPQGTLSPFLRALQSNDLETLTQLRHALRTPLNQIIGYSEMLMESIEENDAGRLLDDLKKIHTAGGQLLALFNDALAPWKIETGKIDLFAMRRDMLAPLNTIIANSLLCQEAAVELGKPDLVSDLKRINQASYNLLRVFESEDFGNRIDVGSKPAEAGTPAHVVPGATSQPAKTAGSAEYPGRTGVQYSGNLLVVDDDAMNREMMARRLQRSGFNVTTAENGLKALEQLKQHSFDLVLLDIIMPELDGFHTLEVMKADSKIRHLPVIMLTALDDVDSTVRCIEAGAEDYVPKPFNPVILHARINASLEKKRLRDQEQAYLTELQAERANSDRLLLNVLPKAVADRLKQGERTIVDSFREATVVFADIVGFTRFSANMAPSRTVQLLNDLFSGFDKLAETYRLEKIKTIGDSYMVVGGVPIPEPEHAERCASMALDMIEVLKHFNHRHSINLDVRVGLNSGPVVAGIIGTKKFSYDLWGDTVNVASRMESQGQPGMIQVSASTHALLAGQFVFEDRGTIEVKNRGLMATYRLVRRLP